MEHILGQMQRICLLLKVVGMKEYVLGMRIPLKIGDFFVYLFVLVLIGGSFLGLYSLKVNAAQLQAEILLDGKLVTVIPLSPGMETKEIRVDAGQGRYNTVRVAAESISIKEANCPDQICVRWGSIDKPGQTIVCLPHRVVVKITGGVEDISELDDIAS